MSEAEWGFGPADDRDGVLLVSPHLDDAVISCGAFLLAHPGASVATLFAASPGEYTNPLNEWDTECGFQPGDDTMAVRRGEDCRALAETGGAVPRWLDFCQNSHVARADPGAIPDGAVDALVTAIVDLQARVVVAPLGLGHPDHIACHATALAVRERTPGTYWLWYSDLPYAYIPRVLSARFRALHRTGFVATPACPVLSHDFAAKWRALCEYTTQVAGLDRLWRLRDRLERGGESYWELDATE